MLWKNNLQQFILLTFSVLFFVFAPITHAQMMGQGWNSQGSQSASLSTEDKADIAAGEKLYQQFQNKQITCSNLKDTDFDKIGEYVMDKQINNEARHAQMNAMMKSMMGESGEENMHIALGKRATGCDSGNLAIGWRGGAFPMMGWPYGNMMGWGGFGFIGVGAILFWLVAFIDLILLGILLLKQIRKKS